MNKSAGHFHLIFWVCAFMIWLSLTRGNHPNWTLRLACTGILIAMSAVYAVLWSPRNLTMRHLWFSLSALLACGWLAAWAINGLYDAAIGPDPRRFSFMSNILMDTAFVWFNTVIAGALAWTLGRATGRQMWFLRRVG